MARDRKAGACEVCGRVTSRVSRTRCPLHPSLYDGSAGEQTARESRTLKVASDGSAALAIITRVRVSSLADLIRVGQIDTASWRIDTHEIKSYEMGSKGADGRPVVTPMWSVSAKLKPRADVTSARAEIALLFDAASRKMAPRRMRPASTTGESVASIELWDVHLGKLAWGKETGGGDYDIDIARTRYQQALNSLLSRIGHVKLRKIWLPVGQDFLHADNPRGTTTAGTPLDMDSRFVKMYVEGRTLLCWAVDRRLEVAPVDVMVVPGNHDRQTAFTLGDSLACYFRNTKHVEVDNAPSVRKYRQHGTNMLLYTHGNAGKLKELPLLMATEQPKMFGDTRVREAHTGHLHGERVEEIRGVKYRVSPALCDPDAWHSEMQYTGNLLASDAYVFHATEGLVLKASHTAMQT